MDIKEIFDAEPKSIYHVLADTDVGFYIPPYQREYSWDKLNIEKLFDDIGHGVRLLIDKPDAITFIGSLITIHDKNHETVDPQIQGSMPGKVMLVIDGQQRLTTLLLILSILHDEIRLRFRKFTSNDEASTWISRTSLTLLDQLKISYEKEQSWGDGNYKWYPRMIRAYVDSWSRDAKTAKYTSQIASYLHNYSIHARNENKKSYEFKNKNSVEKPALKDNAKAIRSKLKKLAESNDLDIEMPSIAEVLSGENLHTTLFQMNVIPSVKSALEEPLKGKKLTEYQQLFRLIILAKFILERVAVTVITAKNEDYAFDMFEALNTTGEPLTAFETFKPKVIKAEGLSKYEKSSSYSYMRVTEEYLDSYRAEKKQIETGKLLIPFALVETGFKLSKRLSDQRRYLKNEYENLKKIDQKRIFVEHLSYSTLFYRDIWLEKDVFKLPVKKSDSQLIRMCIDVLRQAKHHITLSLLIRFFSLIQIAKKTSEPEKENETVQEFEEAIKAIVAFFVLWRTSRRGTGGIDAKYRELMKGGVPEEAITAFSRRNPVSKKINDSPTSQDLKKAFRYMLKEKGKVEDKESWIERSMDIPIYEVNTALSKFLLLAATHDTVPEGETGLVKKAKEDHLEMLSWKQWKNEALTIEHIAPQKTAKGWEKKGWNEEIYDSEELLHCLGNLTLLPAKENSSVGNRSWEEKKLMYQVLSSSTADEAETLLKRGKELGINLGISTQELLRNSKFLPHAKAIGMFEGKWDTDMIHQRSKNMLGLIWDRLAPWLDLTT